MGLSMPNFLLLDELDMIFKQTLLSLPKIFARFVAGHLLRNLRGWVMTEVFQATREVGFEFRTLVKESRDHMIPTAFEEERRQS